MAAADSLPEGHHSPETDEFVALEQHNQALLAEKWTHDVIAFREAISSKMAPYIDATGEGWAYFDYLERDDISDEPRKKDMVILLLPPSCKVRKSEEGIPIIRIMTNEMIGYRGISQCIAEDFMLDHESDAAVMVDAAVMSGWDKEANGPQKTFAPIFNVEADDDLRFLNIHIQPPTPAITTNSQAGHSVIPFGHYTSPIDRQFALDSAWGWLESVWDEYPKYYSTPD